MRRLFALMAIALLCVGFTASGACFPVSSNLRSVSAAAEPSEQEERITRFLLLGCDQSTKLTDSIMLVTVNETKKETSILQIPRDTYTEFTKKDYKKLNGAMSELGQKNLKRFLSDAIGVPIDFFVILKLDFFDDLVDAIGGVDIEIPEDMHYADPSQGLKIDLSQGRAHLSGREAEHFVRYRSGYVNADLGRLDAQKLFLKALLEVYLPNKEISMTTYREGDKADTGYRDLLKKLGFAERELLIEYGYPTQRFVFYPKNKEEIH
jgi:LCP family protein required for cell wall assembly